MRKLIRNVLVGVAVVAVTMTAFAVTFINKTASGSTSATVYFASDPLKTLRVVGVIGTSDKAASVFSFKTGTTAYQITTAAAGSATNITLLATNGIAPNDTLFIEASGVVTNVVVYSLGTTGTNINLKSVIAVPVSAGDSVYETSSATTLKCGAATTSYPGEAIYVANKGRPVQIVLDGTSACSIDSASAIYDVP